MIQEFVAAFENLDEKHAYSNDKYGSGGGGEVEGPVAAAVGHDVVLKWQGSREHRGQLSRSLTARGSTKMGPQYSFGGKIENVESARKTAIDKVAKETPGKAARRGRALVLQIGERLSQKRSDVRKIFIDMDAHKHGSLSYKEFRKGLDVAGVHMSDDDFKLVVKQVDPAGDGRIEYVDFAQTVKGDQRHPDDLTLSPQKTHIATKDGKPIRVGMVMTNSSRNHSDNIHEVMRMPSMQGARPLNERSDRSELVFRTEGHAQEATYEDLSHVATRLKIADTLSAKVGDSLREQYVKLERNGGGRLTANSLHNTLLGKGLDITNNEIEVLMDESGVQVERSNPMSTRLSFDDFKRMTFEAGLGEDSREYNFARAVQLAPGVGHVAGSVTQKKRTQNGSWNVEKHVVKHLTTPAGVDDGIQRKRVTRDKNVESGVGLSLMTPIVLHTQDPIEKPTVDYHIHNRNYQVKHKFTRPSLYMQHDHIREHKLLGGWKSGVNLNGRLSRNVEAPVKVTSRDTAITPRVRQSLDSSKARSSTRVVKLRAGPPPSPSEVRQSMSPKAVAKLQRRRFTPRQQESQIFQHLQYPEQK